jgi:hypothetical protein
MGDTKNAYRILVLKPKGKRPLRRPRHRREDNNRVNLGELGWEAVDQIHLIQERNQWCALVSTLMNLWFSQKAGNFLTN